MEFNYPNYLDTTTQIVVGSNTITADSLFNRDLDFQYSTENFDDDTTIASITINFTSTLTVDRIALLGHNLKQFRVFYNGVTANTFALSTTAATTTLNFITNSETSQYFQTTQVNITSLTLDMYSTQAANAEKAIGYLYIGRTRLDLDNLSDTFSTRPNAAGYQPMISPKQIVHKLSDGGTRVQKISKKYAAKISLRYISSTLRSSLFSIYDDTDPVVFVPFGTTTSWDGVLHEVVWTGNFDFYKFSDDAQTSGFSGNIMLEETPY